MNKNLTVLFPVLGNTDEFEGPKMNGPDPSAVGA